MNAYDIGQQVRFSVTFKSQSGALTDPTGVKAKVQDPSGNEATYTYGVGVAVVKDAGLGKYHLDLTIDEQGLWVYRWEGTGALIAAAENAVVGKAQEV